MSSPSGGVPAGLERALALLRPDLRPAVPAAPEGWLDLAGGARPVSTGRAQDLMLTRAVPLVYQRWWRPALGRLAKGPFGPGMAEEHRLARLLLGLGPGDGVLDVACGPGNFTRDFARVVGEDGLVVGLDASPAMLARAVHDTGGAVAGPVAYVRADATALPFRDASFDAVCCFAALHLFAHPLTAMDEMARVLTPGGRIALMTTCRTASRPGRALDGLLGAAGGMTMFERDEVTAALAARGFADVHHRTTGLVQVVGGRLEP